MLNNLRSVTLLVINYSWKKVENRALFWKAKTTIISVVAVLLSNSLQIIVNYENNIWDGQPLPKTDSRRRRCCVTQGFVASSSVPILSPRPNMFRKYLLFF